MELQNLLVLLVLLVFFGSCFVCFGIHAIETLINRKRSNWNG